MMNIADKDFKVYFKDYIKYVKINKKILNELNNIEYLQSNKNCKKESTAHFRSKRHSIRNEKCIEWAYHIGNGKRQSKN